MPNGTSFYTKAVMVYVKRLYHLIIRERNLLVCVVWTFVTFVQMAILTNIPTMIYSFVAIEQIIVGILLNDLMEIKRTVVYALF